MQRLGQGSVVTVRGNGILTNSYVFTCDTSANIGDEKTKHISSERNKRTEAVCALFLSPKVRTKPSHRSTIELVTKKYSKPYYLEV